MTTKLAELMAAMTRGAAFRSPLGYLRNGAPIWPMGGGDGTDIAGMTEQMSALTAKLKATIGTMEEAKETDGARWQAADDERQRIAKDLTDLSERIEARERAEATVKAAADVEAFLRTVRTPSAKAAIGGGGGGGAVPGDFLMGVWLAGSTDADVQRQGKALLEAGAHLRQVSAGVPAAAFVKAGDTFEKATLGTTDATGGYVIPNNLVEELIKPAMYQNLVRDLVTTVPGVTGQGVDQPWRSGAPSRALVSPFGDTKENRDLAYNGYTATMYTLAAIYDLSKQFLRQSRGAAERDVMTELSHAFALGWSHYVLSGSGSSEPYGLLTALTNSPATFTSSFTPSATTLAGSVSTAIATCSGALAARERQPEAALINSADYWTMLSQGTDNAGFFFNPSAGPTAIPGLRPGVLVSPFGIPVIPDNRMTADRLVVGEFQALKVYEGEAFRVDSSDVANTRWDKNLVGFRGELDMGLDARPAVYAGAFQQVTNLIA